MLRALGGSWPGVLALVTCVCMCGAARMAVGSVGMVDVSRAGALVYMTLPVFIWKISANFSNVSV